MVSKDLADRVRNETGYFLYRWSSEADELHDSGHSQGDRFRASHNLRQHPQGMDLTGHPMKGYLGGISDSELFPAQCKNTALVIFGPLEKETIEQRYVEENVELEVKKPNFFGRILGRAKVSEKTKVPKIVKGHKVLHINELIDTKDHSQGYFIDICPYTRSNLSDEHTTHIVIACAPKLCLEVIEYIRGKIQNVYALVGGMFPEKEFPNVSSQIVSNLRPAERSRIVLASEFKTDYIIRNGQIILREGKVTVKEPTV